MRILVAYASRHGATKGIAERIAEVIERAEHEVTISPVAAVGSIDGYDAFVIGSAAYMGGWLDEATTFVRRHRDVLADRRVWLFSSGPTSADAIDGKGRDQLEVARPKEFAEFTRTIHPRDERVFFGAYDPSAPPAGMAERLMHGFMRLAPAARGALPAGDFRDWPAIESWATTITDELQAATTSV
jgi:menaquinone-dependent protoporphyrinogen oxidase